MKFPVLRLDVNDFINFYKKQNPTDNPKFKKLVFQFHVKKHHLHHDVFLICYAMGDNGDVMHKNPIELTHSKEDNTREIDAPFNLGNLELDAKKLTKLIGPFDKPLRATIIKFDPVRLDPNFIGSKTSAIPKAVGAETNPQADFRDSDQAYIGYEISRDNVVEKDLELNPCPPMHCRDNVD